MPRSVTYNQYLSAPAANDAWTVPTNTTRCKQTCKLCLVMFHMKSAILSMSVKVFRKRCTQPILKCQTTFLWTGKERVLSVIVCVLSKYCSLHLHSEYGQTPLPCLVVQGCCYLVTTATVTLGQAVPSGSQGTFTQDCFTHFTDHTKRGSLSVYKKDSNKVWCM